MLRLFALLTVAGLLVATPSAAPARDDAFVVAGAVPAALAAALDAVGAVPARGRPARIPAAGVRLTPAQVRTLADDPRVVAVEADRPVVLEGTQTGAPWNLDRIDQVTLPLDGTYGWEEAGAGTRAYVVDTGVRSTHDDLAGRVAPGHAVVGDTTEDCHGHGTRMAGLVAGTTHGVAKQATVVPVRTFDCAGSASLSDIVAGMDWIAATHLPGTPGVVNLSLSAADAATLDVAARALVDVGLTVVAAAGNQAGDACDRSPARDPAVVAVGGVDPDDEVWETSNTGPCVDLYAPGAGVASAGHEADDAQAAVSGTSVAAAHVTGVVARILSRPGLHGAGAGAVQRLLALESGATADPGAAPLLHAAPTTPPLPAGDRVALAHPGAAVLGEGREVDADGCVRTDGSAVHLPLDAPHDAVVERVEVIGDTAPGTAQLRAHDWVDGGPRTSVLATVRSAGETDEADAAGAATRLTWHGRHGQVELRWVPDRPAARLCGVRVVARYAAAPDARAMVSLTPCAVLDTRGGPVPTDPVTIDLAGRCGVPAGATAVEAHVVAFPGTGPVVVGPPDGRSLRVWRRRVVQDPVLPVALEDGRLRVDAGGGHVRVVLLGAMVPVPPRPAPAWAAPSP